MGFVGTWAGSLTRDDMLRCILVHFEFGNVDGFFFIIFGCIARMPVTKPMRLV